MKTAIEVKGRRRRSILLTCTSTPNIIGRMATVFLTAPARRELDALPRDIHYRVAGILGRLERWPNVSGAKPLRHGLAGRFRIRTGDYRVQFHLQGATVIVEKIGHRD